VLFKPHKHIFLLIILFAISGVEQMYAQNVDSTAVEVALPKIDSSELVIILLEILQVGS